MAEAATRDAPPLESPAATCAQAAWRVDTEGVKDKAPGLRAVQRNVVDICCYGLS